MAREAYGPDGENQETLGRLATIDEGFAEDEAGLVLALARTSTLGPKPRHWFS